MRLFKFKVYYEDRTGRHERIVEARSKYDAKRTFEKMLIIYDMPRIIRIEKVEEEIC